MIASETAFLSKRARASKMINRCVSWSLTATAAAVGTWIGTSMFAAPLSMGAAVGTVALLAYTTIASKPAPKRLWSIIGVVWAVIVMQHWMAHSAGLFIAGLAWFAAVAGARKSGAKFSLIFWMYPAAFAAGLYFTNNSLTAPMGSPWLWLAAFFGPLLLVQMLLVPDQDKEAAKASRAASKRGAKAQKQLDKLEREAAKAAAKKSWKLLRKKAAAAVTVEDAEVPATATVAALPSPNANFDLAAMEQRRKAMLANLEKFEH